jgi:hypothetical protein
MFFSVARLDEPVLHEAGDGAVEGGGIQANGAPGSLLQSIEKVHPVRRPLLEEEKNQVVKAFRGRKRFRILCIQHMSNA